MKTLLRYLLQFIFIAIITCSYLQVKAQLTGSDTTNIVVGDTMFVAWQWWNGVKMNALYSAVCGDTASDGTRANLDRVYVLKRGGIYWEADDIIASFPLRLVGQPYDNTAENRPALLQMRADFGDGPIWGHFITSYDDVTLKNIYVTGAENRNGIQTIYQPITFKSNNKNFIIDNCIFERSNYALLVWTGNGNTISITNCKFRNLIESPPTQQWNGRGISIWSDQESVIIENNTFFNIAAFCFQIEGGSAKYLLFNHNTIVNLGRGVMSNSGNWWRMAYFTNNLIINGWWEGEGYADMHSVGRDSRLAYDGLFKVGALPPNYNTQESRRVVIVKNSAYLDPLITAKYGTGGVDTITRAWFIDPVSKADYLEPYAVANGGGMHVADTAWLDAMPAGMTDYLRDVDWRAPQYTTTNGATMIDSMWAFITQVRGSTQMYTTFFYRPEVSNTSQTWPLPENFAYTPGAEKLTGTDGLPLGDLNWFPSDLAAFEADKQAFIDTIEAMAGVVRTDSIKDTREAELGTVGGTAEVASIEGPIYYTQVNGEGSITWTFDVPAGKAGTYDSKWLVNETGRVSSGPILHIDGTTFVDVAHGWGQFVFDQTKGPAFGLPTNEWIWVGVTNDSVTPNTVFNLAEGAHIIGVAAGGWGTISFSEIDLALHGDADTIKLKGKDAVSSIIPPALAVLDGWLPSNFKYVNLGTAGTDLITCTTDVNGTYKIRVFGQNTTGAGVPISITDGVNSVTPILPNVAAGTQADVTSSTFPATAGSTVFTFSGANVNIDYVQFIKQDVETVVEDDGSLRPGGFALEQNFPNPFNPSTTIKFVLGKAANVKLTVYNLLGQKIATLIDCRMNAGPQSSVFDASRLASGVYFYRLEAGSFISQKKMLLLK